MALAAKIPYDHPYAGGFPGLGGQALPTDSDCLTYLAAVKAADGAGVEVGVAVAVDAFFRDSKAAGVFDALKACCILCGARTITGALVPLAGSAPTAQGGWSSGDYSRTAGLTGDGAALYLESNRAGSDDSQDDCHVSVYVSAAAGASERTHISNSRTWIAEDDSATYFRLNAFASASVVSPNQTGFLGVTRISSGSISYRISGTTTSAASSSQIPLGDIEVFRKSDDSQYFDGTLAFYSIGSNVDLGTLDAAVTTLISDIGSAL